MKKTLLYGIFALSIASATLTSCEDMFEASRQATQ